MKKILVVLAHPDIENNSVANKVIVDRLGAQKNLDIRDLTRLYPDFRINVEREQQALLEADTVVFQFPFYWYSVPGILKHWLDEVFTYGFAYGSTGTKLQGKRLIVSTTIGGPESSYRSGEYNSYSVEELLKPLQQTANLAGMTFVPPVLSHSMVYIPDVYNVKEEVEERAQDHFDRLSTAIGQRTELSCRSGSL